MLFGCMMFLDMVVFDYCGFKVVVIGKLNIVGKLMVLLFLECECMVMVIYIFMCGLFDIVWMVDLVVVVVGSLGFVWGDWVKFGVIVIDVGINWIVDENGMIWLIGDVVFCEMDYVGVIILVFGGVGLMMIVCLLVNMVKVVRWLLCDWFEIGFL